MSKPFDWFAQEILEQALSSVGKSVAEKKVASAAQFIDLTFVPNAKHAQHRSQLGLLGRMTALPCLLEPFRKAPRVTDLLECIRKQLTHHHSQQLSAKTRSRPRLPWELWVLSAGRPVQALAGLALKQRKGWPRGVYAGPTPALPYRVVVISELPETLETLVLRLLGAGVPFAKAARQLAALPEDHPLRRLADPLLVQLRLKAEEGDEVSETEKEQIRMATQSIYEKWESKVRAQGLSEGRVESARASLLEVLEARSFRVTTAERSQIESCSDLDLLSNWHRQAVTAGSTAEVFASASVKAAKRRAAKPKSKLA